MTESLPSPGVVRDLRRRLVLDSLEQPEAARDAHRLLRLVLRCGMLQETWIDGQCVPIGGAHSHFIETINRVVDRLEWVDGRVQVDDAMGALQALWHPFQGECERQRSLLPEEALRREWGAPLLALAIGGGGGVTYISLGALDLLEGLEIRPSMVMGASMGSIVAAMRSLSNAFAIERVLSMTEELNEKRLLSVSSMHNRYSIPGALRLMLRSGLGPSLQKESGHWIRMGETAIPLRVVVSGMAGEAPHAMDYYEHLFEGSLTRRSLRRLIVNMTRLISEFLVGDGLLQPLVLGGDALTSQLDVADALGFSSSIPGLLHYDVDRDDNRSHRVLTEIMQTHGVSRLIDGGFSDNVPALSLRREVQTGALGRSNVIIVGLDGFAPNLLRQPLWLPAQRLIRTQVQRSEEEADYWWSFKRPLSPQNILPGPSQLREVVQRGRDEFTFIARALQEALVDPWSALEVLQATLDTQD